MTGDTGRDSMFGSLDQDKPLSGSPFDLVLLEEVKKLPLRKGKTRFIDFDGILTDDQHRYDEGVAPWLRGYNGKAAYPIIAKMLGTPEDPTGFREMSRRLHMVGKYKFGNTGDFYDPDDLSHIILSAGSAEYQDIKITDSFGEEAKRIVVPEARDKIDAILQFFIELGYITDFDFIDDRIGEWIDSKLDGLLARELGVDAKFYLGTGSRETMMVTIPGVTSNIQDRVENLLAA